jgi:receptor protein-tyrosine kinase
MTCLGLAAAALLSSLQPPAYRSRAALEVEGLNENFLDLHNVYPGVSPGADAAGLLQTQAEVFQQDALLQKVARKLRIETRPEYRTDVNIAERLREDIHVEPSRNSRILQIVCDARDAALAAALCNTLAEAGIDQAMETRQRVARETYESLKPRVDELRTAFRQSEGRGGPRAPEAEMYRRFYENMLQKAGDAWMASHVPQANIRVVGPAEPASRPYKPNFPLNLAIGTAAGLVLGVGWVMLRADSRCVLREPGEATLHLSVPELGAIPRVRQCAAAWKDQESTLLSESFRATSASIVSATRKGGHCRTLVVTSAWPNEGKTTVVHNLGKALAETSERVLLIDGDTRRPRLHKLFDEANSWGLTDALREPNAIDELPVEALVKKTSVPHVYLLPSGSCADNIFGLLCTERMSRLWPRFQEAFDYVLVDAPPCLEFADARMFAQHAGELLLVVRANHTHRRATQAAIDRIHLDGIPMIGVVLNQWDQQRSFVYRYSKPADGFLGGLL